METFKDELLASYEESNSYLKNINLKNIELQIYTRSIRQYDEVILLKSFFSYCTINLGIKLLKSLKEVF